MSESRCGYVAIVGRPNVGKSTLLNYLVGEKVSITSRKPHTTRQQICGIQTQAENQIIFVDTPGLKQDNKRALERYMSKVALTVLDGVDVVVLVVESLVWRDDDQAILDKLTEMKCPIILVVNKVDKVTDKEKLLPYLARFNERQNLSAIVPLSAKKGRNTEILLNEIVDYLPEGPHLFPADQLSDRSVRFQIAELIREKLMRALGEELPYVIAIDVEQFEEKKENNKSITHIAAVIYVERPGQKAIVIGKQGQRLKEIGSRARQDIEILLDNKVFLKLWVKVKSDWSDDEQAMKRLGYDGTDY